MEIHRNESNILETEQLKSTYHHHDCEKDNNCEHNISDSKNSQYFEPWTSPSDLIVDMVGLKPPLTSKLTKSKAHINILSIGENYLEIQKDYFNKSIMKILKDNDDIWKFILKNEIKTVYKKVKDIFKEIFDQKRITLVKEMSSFYEKTLAELEEHVKSEVKSMAYSFQSDLTNQLNKKLGKKLKHEKENLEKKLNEELNLKITKVRNYYDLLLKSESCRYTRLKNKVIQERNEAVKLFYKQMESERLTSNLYVLSSERKKCKVKQLLLKNIQHKEIIDHLKILVLKDDLLRDLDEQKETLPILNNQWQEQVVKMVRLFLKFISFSLTLLPEQTTFLLDFEKMVILQLNEFQKQHYNPPQILFYEEEQNNMFQFYEMQSQPPVCDKEPFQVIGSLENPFSLFLSYGSRETLASRADYPYFRLQGKHIYAKCHNFEEIKEILGAKIYRCTSKDVEIILSPVGSFEEKQENSESKINLSRISSESSSIHMEPVLEKVNSIKECPNNCGKIIRKYESPMLNLFLDYSEQNFEKLTSNIDVEEPKLIDPTKVKDIVFSDIPFPAVEKDLKTVATQCSSQDDVDYKDSPCDCTVANNYCDDRVKACKVHDVFLKRELSLKKLLKTNPKLFSILFSDEPYDYKV